MKRVGYLADKVFTRENVRAAWDAYNKNRPVKLRKAFDQRRADRILQAARRDFAAVVADPREKTIFESGKERRLQIPRFAASIAMLMLWNVAGPYVEKRIHSMSFSSRKGMGGHLAAAKCSRFLRTHRKDAKYSLYFDVRKFYQHIQARIMMARLEAIFKDRRILDMFDAVLRSATGGLPIGYPFSHSLANLYLVPLYFLVRSIKGVSRAFVYMDNWIVFARFKKAAHKARIAAKAWLAGMGCEIKDDWQVFPTASRRVKICGFALHAARPPRLYRRIWRRTRRAFCVFAAHPTKRLYLSLMSRKGWLMAINKHFSPAFKLPNGGYLWQAR